MFKSKYVSSYGYIHNCIAALPKIKAAILRNGVRLQLFESYVPDIETLATYEMSQKYLCQNDHLIILILTVCYINFSGKVSK